MIEYTITHTFDKFRSNFFNRKGKKRGKAHINKCGLYPQKSFGGMKVYKWPPP